MQTKTYQLGALIIIAVCILTVPVSAFTADSLSITINQNGDATAVFRFTLEGVIENAIPQSMLEDQLQKGLSTGSEPPTLVSMDKSSATILMKNFANVQTVPGGTQYQTSSMDFKKAQIALQNSGLSSVIAADFSPKIVTVTFPDGYMRTFSDVSSLPSVIYTVVSKSLNVSPTISTGTLYVNSSPSGAEISMDGVYIGNSPGTFPDISPGNHTIIASKEGFDLQTKTVMVAPDQVTHVTFLLIYGVPTPLPTAQSAFPFLPGFDIVPALVSLCSVTLILNQKFRH